MNNDKKPKNYPFWGRLKIEKKRPTLVIDEELVIDKSVKTEIKYVEGFVHREVISTKGKGRMEILPNPDKSCSDTPMYLKSPRKIPKFLVKELDQDFDMPQELIEMYEKNNKKE